MLGPTAACWLEVLCSRRDAVRTAAILAATRAVEIELRPEAVTESPVQELGSGLAEYERLRVRYERYWQRGRFRLSPFAGTPRVVLDLALTRLAAWRKEADPLIDTLQDCEAELSLLKRLGGIIERLRHGLVDLHLIAQCGPVLASFCALLPRQAEPKLPDWVIVRPIAWEEERCFLILGPAKSLGEVKHQISAAKGRIIERPDWLRGEVDDAGARILARCRFLSVRIVHLYAELDSLFEDHALGDVLAEMAWLAWFRQHVGALEREGDYLAWITGWTDDPSGRIPRTALDRYRSGAILRLAAPPRGARPPQILTNPQWLRPFEVFARALGVPGAEEADPTPVLAVVVPWLFGYMFGDVGQGLVLVLLGWWLRPRFEVARLLIPCGLSAMAFGLLFGSIFAREDLIPALWLHPLDAPLVVLLVPLVLGVGLLGLGQALL